MLRKAYRSASRSCVTLILAFSFIALAAPRSAASNGPMSDKSAVGSARSPEIDKTASVREEGSAAEAPKNLTISFVLYEGANNAQPAASAPEPRVVTRPRTVGANPKTSVPPIPNPPGGPPTSTAPMTPGEKFKLFAQRSFLTPAAYGLSIVSGVYGEWTDSKNNHHHASPGDFAADSMTRAARSFTFRANANFFEKFMFASLFRQDPRYHRSDKKGAGAKIGYAVSRLFVTQGDRSGKDQFNASFIAGGLAASGMANLWERDERRDLHHFATRWGVHMGLTAVTHILSEFIGGQ